uniref:Uncharacterized protein n=1 Tax=Avena sativa TaxID=4498 RepID=A0ACD5U7J1_AVESA
MAATVAGVSVLAPARPPASHVDAATPVPRCWEDAAISLGLVAVQLAGAAYMVVLTPILALGLDPLFLVTFGSLSTGLITLPFALKLESAEIILSLVFVGSLVGSVCIMFQTWALEKGPVVVSLFSPTQTVGTTIFSALFLGRVVQPASMLGMIFLFSGLYVVLWAKKKEGQVLPAHRVVADGTADDIEKPLLLPH